MPAPFSDALILVDIQNDFLPGGALAVPEGDAVMDVAHLLFPLFRCVAATQDWHPPDHGSFAANHPGKQPGQRIELAGLDQILWPIHCVQHTRGAAFASALPDMSRVAVFPKGTDPDIDSYSGFFDNGHRRATGLGEFLEQQGVTRIYLLGLATDYCVKFTALDGLRLGFETVVLRDGCRGVNLHPGDDGRAFDEMRQAGVIVETSEQVVERALSAGQPFADDA